MSELAAASTDALCSVGSPIVFEGYADDFVHGISAIQFSLDDGASWTSYPTEGAVPEKGMNWRFAYTPSESGRYLLRARAVDGQGVPSEVVTRFSFRAVEKAIAVAAENSATDEQGALPSPTVEAPSSIGGEANPRLHGPLREAKPRTIKRTALGSVQTYGDFRLRAVGGGSLAGAKLFRSAELTNISPEASAFLTDVLRIRSVYDIRNQWESALHAEPCLAGAKSVAMEPSDQRRRKDAGNRLVAGVIGEYGKPEERMRKNYRRYAKDYPLIGATLRAIASEGAPALVHCVNGKDRTGVLCAVLLRAAGWHADDIMADYLAANTVNAAHITREFQTLSTGMTDEEEAILLSFLEARPSYLAAFFDEAESLYGSFELYLREGLRLETAHVDVLAWLAGCGTIG